MPISHVASIPDFMAATAKKTIEKIEISVYRFDSEDNPTPINADTYAVWEGLPPQLNVTEMIQASSTEANPNFKRYSTDYVFIVKEESGLDHWLPDLPTEVRFLLKKAP